MAYQHKPNSGNAFPNDDKQSDKHPDYKGSVLIDNKEYWVSIWDGETQAGKPKRSLKFTEIDNTKKKVTEQKAKLAPAPLPDGFSDDIPF
jgi:hypothetical protein